MEESGDITIYVSVGGEIDIPALGGIDRVMNSKAKLEVMKKEVVWVAQGEGMAQRACDSPSNGIEFPVEGLEEIQNWFEGVVGFGFWLGDSVVESEDVWKVVGVEKKMSTQRRKGGQGGGSEWVGGAEFGSQQECEGSLTAGASVIEVNTQNISTDACENGK